MAGSSYTQCQKLKFRYLLESGRSSDVNFNNLKGCFRPEAALQLCILDPGWLDYISPLSKKPNVELCLRYQIHQMMVMASHQSPNKGIVPITKQ